MKKKHVIPLILPKHTPRFPKVRAGSDGAEEGDVVDAGAVLDPAVGGRHAGDTTSRFEGEFQRGGAGDGRPRRVVIEHSGK